MLSSGSDERTVSLLNMIGRVKGKAVSHNFIKVCVAFFISLRDAECGRVRN
jgi:hypothetical protein